MEEFDGLLIFVRTRIQTVELADKLAARGYTATALNGDIPQKQREATIEKLKSGKLDIVVATDVAARGLDVQRISHVINYDIPPDVETYIHRIGRTGRAGRSGDAILFAANRERRLLAAIEKATGKAIEKMVLPTADEVTDKRVGRFKQRITEELSTADLDLFRKLVQDYQHEYGVPVVEIAAALGSLAQGRRPLLVQAGAAESEPAKGAHPGSRPAPGKPHRERRDRDDARQSADDRPPRDPASRPARKPRNDKEKLDVGMERYRLEVGHVHGVKPGNIVGAIANEAEIDSEYIGRVEIFDDYSTVDLPEGMPKEIFKHLRSVWVSGQRLQISRLEPGGKPTPDREGQRKPDKRKGGEPRGEKHTVNRGKTRGKPPRKSNADRQR